MGDVTPKIRLYIFLSVMVLLLNVSVIVVDAWTEGTTITEIEQTEEDIDIDYEESNFTEFIVKTTALTTTSFLPFTSVIVSAVYFADVFPINLIVGFVVVIISSIQVYLLIAIILNHLPFFNI